MAAPSVTARVAPTGRKVPDGQGVKIAFKSNPDLLFWERSLTPPSIDGGDAIDITDSFNTTWETSAARTLKKLGDVEVEGFWEPGSYAEVLALVNVEDEITLIYPDGSTESHFAFVRMFEREEVARGEPLTGTLTITPTSWDHVNRVEAGPNVVSVAGT